MADYSFNFPDPVTPIAHETLHVHNLFMIVILVIFFAVFGIMIYSMWAHRKSRGHAAAGDGLRQRPRHEGVLLRRR